ncbi:MAG: M50 family metallopeptidase, partial [Thermoguttaceae bacterium]
MLPIIFTALHWLFLICVVAVALGFVIFVHELGHFLVAKLCGVKVEKFYLGYDIGGWKVCKFRWGETEYGIGAFFLGGYVKMLGQEDNPARLQEEIERAKLRSPENAEVVPAAKDGAEKPLGPEGLAAAQEALYDPRSYLAKSVPKRMAIISAGVIMNVFFAFIMAVVAYSMGVEQNVCSVGKVNPGEAAWRAGLQTGDHIIEVAGKKAERFKDLHKNITLGDIDNGVRLLVDRPGKKKPLQFLLHPDNIHGFPTIGIGYGMIPVLSREIPVWPG